METIHEPATNHLTSNCEHNSNLDLNPSNLAFSLNSINNDDLYYNSSDDNYYDAEEENAEFSITLPASSVIQSKSSSANITPHLGCKLANKQHLKNRNTKSEMNKISDEVRDLSYEYESDGYDEDDDDDEELEEDDELFDDTVYPNDKFKCKLREAHVIQPKIKKGSRCYLYFNIKFYYNIYIYIPNYICCALV